MALEDMYELYRNLSAAYKIQITQETAKLTV